MALNDKSYRDRSVPAGRSPSVTQHAGLPLFGVLYERPGRLCCALLARANVVFLVGHASLGSN
jgi:hypothetical protein